jgi:hypothetical protein
MKEITLSRSGVALVDDEDFERASASGPWHLHTSRGRSYAVHSVTSTSKRWLHRIIAGAGVGQEVDHLNGDGLDNRRANLRLCTHAENGRNRAKQRPPASSKYKGVSRYHDRWRATIGIGNHKLRSLGYFKTEDEAADAYDVAAKELFGEFARVNERLLA